jgi:hypothetical protein
MRRTFITLARTDGAIDGLLRSVTHGPTSDMLDVYSSPPWSALCAEVAKLKLELREGTLVPITNSGASRWVKPTRLIARAPGGHQPARARATDVQPAAMLAGMKATPTGFERRFRVTRRCAVRVIPTTCRRVRVTECLRLRDSCTTFGAADRADRRRARSSSRCMEE